MSETYWPTPASPKPYWGRKPLSTLLDDICQWPGDATAICLMHEWDAEVTLCEEATKEREKTLEEKFLEQASKWQKETQHLSSPGQRMMHPSYQAILGMGNENRREIVSLMIRDMQHHRRPWYWALSYLAQDNPVSQSDAGNMDRIIKAWVNWEKAQRLP